jgi:DNA-binding XRE family transcriptional regulator
MRAECKEVCNYTQSKLLCKWANSFSMEQLGDKVRRFREHPSRKWTTARLAREVGTTRQSIENLESGAVAIPRYVASLAQVMATSVEELLGTKLPATTLTAKESIGAYRVGSRQGPNESRSALLDALETVCSAIADSSPEVRPAIAANLRQCALDGGPLHYVPLLAALMQAQPRKQPMAADAA